jgi:hypothetical protein
MNLKDILAIVEHLETKKRSSAYGSAKISSLDDIAIFTEKEDMPLGKVFDLIYDKEKGGPTIDSKADNGKLKTWFEELLPYYSKDKVYTSDIKKVAMWYNTLHKLNLLLKDEPEAEAEVKADIETAPVVEKKKKKATAKPKAK